MTMVKGAASTSMDDYQLNTTTMIRHAVRNYPTQEILYRSNGDMKSYTYQDAYTRMGKLAHFMTNGLGVKPGDKIGILDWNSHRHYELYFAIPGIAATMLQMNLRIAPPELAYVANHSEVKYIFVDETLLPLAEAIAPHLQSVEGFIIMTDKPLSERETTLTSLYHYEEEIAEEEGEYDWPIIDETTAYSACYTSGTTGRPKGVYYSHRNIYLHTMAIVGHLGASSNDCILMIVPMFHSQAWGKVHMATMMGSKMIFPGRFLQRTHLHLLI